MLGAGGEPVVLHAANNLAEQAAGEVWVIGNTADVDQRVAEIEVEVADGGEGPIGADAPRFKRGELAVIVGEVSVIGGAQAHQVGQDGEALQHAAAAVFKVGGDEHRDFGVACVTAKELPAVFKADIAGFGNDFAEEKGGANLIGDKAILGNAQYSGLLCLLANGHG